MIEEQAPISSYSEILGETICEIMEVVKKVVEESESLSLDSEEDRLTLQRNIEKELWRFYRVQ